MVNRLDEQAGPGELIQALEAARDILDRPEPLLISPDRAAALSARAVALAKAIRDADDRLCLGLVGGTGVGKSTLINALAGRRISASSDQRPTTDHLVLYRHRDNGFSLAPDEEVHLHQAPALERISLADFPDFDSLEPAHRQALAKHFSRLDLLLWVVDPVKYADQALFHWLSLAPQSRVNSVFIFNKTDEYRDRYGDEARAVQQEVTADLAAKLKKYAGLTDPVVLPLSALDALKGRDGPGRTGFEALTDRIGQLAEKKRRLSLKQHNRAAMTRDLLADLVREADTGQARKGLERLDAALGQGEADVTRLVDSEAGRLRTTLSRSWRAGLSAEARERSPWPLNFFLFLWDRLTGLFGKTAPAEHPSGLPRPEKVVLVRRLETWRAELSSAFGPDDPPPARACRARLDALPDPDALAESGARDLLADGMEASRKLARRYRWHVRHHLLPLLALAYPFLPLLAAWVFPEQTSGQSGGLSVRLTVGWGDVLPLAEVLLGLYLVQTLYFAFSLDRAAARSLDDLAAGWGKDTRARLQTALIEPVRRFRSELEAEIAAVEALGERVGTGDGE